MRGMDASTKQSVASFFFFFQNSFYVPSITYELATFYKQSFCQSCLAFRNVVYLNRDRDFETISDRRSLRLTTYLCGPKVFCWLLLPFTVGRANTFNASLSSSSGLIERFFLDTRMMITTWGVRFENTGNVRAKKCSLILDRKKVSQKARKNSHFLLGMNDCTGLIAGADCTE